MPNAPMPELNEKLLNCVLKRIEQEVHLHSGRYNQNNWADIDWSLVAQAVEEGEKTAIDQTMCGTNACVAGWACMLSTPLKEWKKILSKTAYDWPAEAQQRLGLTDDERCFLFSGTDQRSASAQLDVIRGRVKVIRECRARGTPLYAHKDASRYFS